MKDGARSEQNFEAARLGHCVAFFLIEHAVEFVDWTTFNQRESPCPA